jgi:hypothetical protein
MILLEILIILNLNRSTVSATVTSSSSTVTWTVINEATNASVIYSTNASNLSSTASTSTFSTSNSVLLSSLSASTLYYYNITSCDNLGNCNSTGLFNFTTSAASSTTTSSGSGGGIRIVPDLTQSVSLANFEKEYKQLETGSQLQFSVSGNSHSITIDKIYSDRKKIDLTIRSDPITVTLEIGKPQTINLSEDGSLYIELISIKNFKADIIVKEIKKKKPLEFIKSLILSDDKIEEEVELEEVNEMFSEKKTLDEKSLDDVFNENIRYPIGTWIVTSLIAIGLIGYVVMINKKAKIKK